jgi:hypothetical protein
VAAVADWVRTRRLSWENGEAGVFPIDPGEHEGRCDVSTDPILIKRYARSRFYHPSAARYVSLETLRVWDSAGIDFVVRDAETGADVTRVVLA